MTTVDGPPVTTGWTADDSTFGARLALVRQRMGWGNVKEAATQCGVPVESWRTWERDNVAPRNIVDVARKVAATTGCDFYWLLAGPRPDREHTAPARPNARYGTGAKRRTRKRQRRLIVSNGRSTSESTRPVSDVPLTRRRPAPVRPTNQRVSA